jgi:Skp family chaperone for outer membrane proteins
MKRTTHLLTLTTLVMAAVIITMIVSPADANKRYAIESGDIAYVDVFNLIDKALLAEDMANARAEFNTDSTEVITSLQGQLQALQTQLSTMTQTDPNAATAYQQYQTVQSQLDNASRQINEAYQTLIAQQIAQGYTEIYAAANEIGEQEGFSFVFATRSDGELIQIDTITGITQEILARPLMTPAGGVDLTELVRVKLGYPEKAPEPVVETDTPSEIPAVEIQPATTTQTETPEVEAEDAPVIEEKPVDE